MQKLNDFGSLAQRVWAEPSLIGKRAAVAVMIDQMISNQEKKTMFRRQIETMDNRRLDRFASDVMLCDTDRRIK